MLTSPLMASGFVNKLSRATRTLVNRGNEGRSGFVWVSSSVGSSGAVWTVLGCEWELNRIRTYIYYLATINTTKLNLNISEYSARVYHVLFIAPVILCCSPAQNTMKRFESESTLSGSGTAHNWHQTPQHGVVLFTKGPRMIKVYKYSCQRPDQGLVSSRLSTHDARGFPVLTL